jgi:hypothetical protein
LLVTNVGGEGLDGDARVELLHLRQRCFSAILAYIGVADEELRAQIIFSHDLVVCECNGAYAGEDKVLGDFVGKGFDGDE